jgi:hypothetical protein
MTEAPSPSLRPLVVPLALGLLLTGGVAWLVCKPPMRPSLSWLELIAFTLLYVGLAVGVQAAVLIGLSKAFGEHIEVSSIPVSDAALIEGSWLSAAWMPLFVLLVRENSVWAAIVPPLAVLPVTDFLRRWRLASNSSTVAPVEGLEENPAESPALFRVDDSPSLLHSVLPAAIAAVTMESGLAAALVDYDALAGLLFAIGAIFFVWRYPANSTKAKANITDNEQPAMRRGLAWRLAIVVLLTGAALLPYLKYKGFGGMGAFLHANRPSLPAVQAKESQLRPHAGGHYSGVVLYLPQKPKEKIVAPAPTKVNAFGPAHGKPMVIPFDGVYWYFQPPDERPEADAHVVHGDPIKTGVHSTEYLPLLMEAHQELGSSMAMDCCRTLRVVLRNGDNLRGMIFLEVILKDTISKRHSTMSLGSLYLRSSEGGTSNAAVARPEGHSVEETLSYPIPESARGRRFNEITVVFQPAQERSLVGARVAIEQFVFEP